MAVDSLVVITLRWEEKINNVSKGVSLLSRTGDIVVFQFDVVDVGNN